MAEKLPSDPFPHLPRRPLFATFEQIDAGLTLREEENAKRITAQAEEVYERGLILRPSGKAVPEPSKSKRGRPVADKPWIAAGISRMTWYRRKKKK